MEQTQQTLQKTAQKPERTPEETPRAERRQSAAGRSAQALLQGVSLWKLPQSSLQALAERVGNSSMLALMALQAPEAETRLVELSGPEQQTAAFPVPETDCPLAPAQSLVGGPATAAFDPGGLA